MDLLIRHQIAAKKEQRGTVTEHKTTEYKQDLKHKKQGFWRSRAVIVEDTELEKKNKKETVTIRGELTNI